MGTLMDVQMAVVKWAGLGEGAGFYSKSREC
jgi:hypothetical protein